MNLSRNAIARHRNTTRCGLAALAAGTVAASLAAPAVRAQMYDTRVVAEGLDTPTGITYAGGYSVYFTEVPTPGVGGSMGGRNRVVSINLLTGVQTEISMGEPEPLNLALNRSDDSLYWTCRSAGVILERDADGNIAPILENLNEPTGVTTIRNYVIFTELPDEGMSTENNRVVAWDGSQLIELANNEPAPTDIAATPDGTLYWTCRTAGVIMSRTIDGTLAPLFRGLDNPVGIATDNVGNLYWTEVPTPGVPGSMGGRNKVWKYNFASRVRTLVNEGDPEPTDITVIPNGAAIAWTCTSAGVIVVATEM